MIIPRPNPAEICPDVGEPISNYSAEAPDVDAFLPGEIVVYWYCSPGTVLVVNGALPDWIIYDPANNRLIGHAALGDSNAPVVTQQALNDFAALALATDLIQCKSQGRASFNLTVYFNCPSGTMTFTGTLPGWITFTGTQLVGAAGTFEASTVEEATSIAQAAINAFGAAALANGSLKCSTPSSCVPGAACFSDINYSGDLNSGTVPEPGTGFPANAHVIPLLAGQYVTITETANNPAFANDVFCTLYDPSGTEVAFGYPNPFSYRAVVSGNYTIYFSTDGPLFAWTGSAKCSPCVAADNPLQVFISFFPVTLGNSTVNCVAQRTLVAGTGPITAPLTWSVIAGSLPPGVTLSSGGAIGGAPTTPGTYNFTIQVMDSSVPPVCCSQAFSMVVDTAKKPDWTQLVWSGLNFGPPNPTSIFSGAGNTFHAEGHCDAGQSIASDGDGVANIPFRCANCNLHLVVVGNDPTSSAGYNQVIFKINGTPFFTYSIPGGDGTYDIPFTVSKPYPPNQVWTMDVRVNFGMPNGGNGRVMTFDGIITNL